MAGKIRLSKPSVQTKSPALKPAEVKKNWVVFDAEGVILGRLAAVIAHRLRGKHRADYTPSVDCGDQVIVINAEKVTMSGHKLTQDKYYYHTGYPGGIKARTRAQILAGHFPERVIQKAVQRMLPEGTLGRKQLGNLKVYAGSEHPHAAQSPVAIEFATANPKNKRVN